MAEKQRNPRALLDDVIGLIEDDLKHIKKAAKSRALDPEEALTLSRYSKALLDIVKDSDTDEAKMKKNLGKLSDKDLKAMVDQVLGSGSADGVV